MLKGFNEETSPLTEYEMTELMPVMIRGLQTKKGKANAVTNKHIVRSLKSNFKISEPRVRKIINNIRTNHTIPGLIATSEGYYIAETEQELIDYEESLLGREMAIRQVRESIAMQRRMLYRKEQQSSLF